MEPTTLPRQNSITPVSRYFKRMSEYLALNAKKAYEIKDFHKRSEVISKAVAVESSALLCLSIGRMDVITEVQKVFYDASIEMCNGYAPLFKKDGVAQININTPKTEDNQKYFAIFDYLTALPGPLAKKYLKDTLRVFGMDIGDEKIYEMIANLKFNELILLAAIWLGTDEKEAFGIANSAPDEIRDILYSSVDKNSYAWDLIPNLSLNDAGYTLPLSSSQINFLETAIRLGNCTWKAGQVHKALIEGTTERIEPDKRNGAFNVDEEYRLTQYKKFTEKFKSEKVALIRIAFDFYKSISVLIREDITK